MAVGTEPGDPKIGKTAWLSQGLEELLHELEHTARDSPPVFDVLIVGSGYGGAVAAAELAGCSQAGARVSVCVLERGREYLPGMFPARMAELPVHVRFTAAGSGRPRGRLDGLFDVRVGPDVNAILGSGLGGGSLVNAGIMARPNPDAYRSWPAGLAADLGHYLGEAESLLGVHPGFENRREPQKLTAFRALGARVRAAPMTIGLDRGANADGVHIGACRRCGDCATGCNHGAKNSLDSNLLVRASNAGARIYTGATVLRVERDGGAWLVHVVHTDEATRRRQGDPAKLKARKVILAAGTFGSTEILLRSARHGLRLSRQLGRRFSSNGDAIAVLYDHEMVANAVSNEALPEELREVGPTITGMLDLRGSAENCVIQEIAIPGPLRRLFEETASTANLLHTLGTGDPGTHRAHEPSHDPCAIDGNAVMRTSAFVMMGDDGAEGLLRLDQEGAPGDGAIRVRWPRLRQHPVFQRQIDALRRLASAWGRGGRVLPNPMWDLVPESMRSLLDDRRGPLLTVHPLGGCAMGSDAADGVVNELGEVFDGVGGTSVHDGLIVLDGSIVRNALAINPALTIAALSLRAVRALRRAWGWTEASRIPPLPVARPLFREMPRPAAVRSTEIEIAERMSGEATLRRAGRGTQRCHVELTLRFRDASIADLVMPGPSGEVPMARRLHVREGRLRIFRWDAWDAWRRSGLAREELERHVEISAPLHGMLTLLHREWSWSFWRRCRALGAWLLNRGMRDAFQAAVRREGGAGSWRTLARRAREAWALASRAGEVRLLAYELSLGTPVVADTALDIRPFGAGARVEGLKRLTYARRANPWRQLMELRLSRLPGMPWLARRPVLQLDGKYLAEERIPLLRIASQNDQISALADLAALAGYFLRLLLNIHIWSFRRPDLPAPRRNDPARDPRLPWGIPGRLPESAPLFLPVRLPGQPDAQIRLMRYRPDASSDRPPVVMIHGYSASGTTFAHPAVNPCMAEYFFDRGRDVWVVDLRTSSGMRTARVPWAFEHAALADIPVAIDRICRETGAASLDVFAHCMGSAMLTMAVLSVPRPAEPYYDERLLLPRRIRRAVLSQVAPLVVMSPANIFRGYAMSYLRHFLPLDNYQFRTPARPGLLDQLVDRLLATLPYPNEEFDVENPPWRFWRRTPFVGTRHRMDALYGRDFSLADRDGEPLLDDAVLEHIDDLFGPLSIETVSQAIHFARTEFITNNAGRNVYVLPANIQRRWTFPTASIHGTENGLADIATLGRFHRYFNEAGMEILPIACEDYGHQDSLIGRRAERVFREVFGFFDRDDPYARPSQ